MYVKTEDNEIINLNHYPRVVLYPDKGNFQLCAVIKPDMKPDTIADSYGKIQIAVFKNDEEARVALDALFSNIREGKLAWDANAYKTLQQAQLSDNL